MFVLLFLAMGTITGDSGAIKFDGGVLEIRSIQITADAGSVATTVEFRNLSDKTIMGLKYQILFEDYFNEKLATLERKDHIHLEPMGVGRSTWLIKRNQSNYAAMYDPAKKGVVKTTFTCIAVAFKDGSISDSFEAIQDYQMSEIAAVAAPEPETPTTIARVGQVGVEPPVFLSKSAPVYPQNARNEKLQGYVILEAVLRKNGRIDNIKVLRGLGNGKYGFEENAKAALKKWTFAPGKVNNKPADVRMTLKIDFILK